MSRKSTFVFLLALLILTGLTFRIWFSPLMIFVGANTDLIQGLANLVQIFIWIGTGVILWFGLLRPSRNHQNETPVDGPQTNRKMVHKTFENEATVEGDGSIAQGLSSTAAGKGGTYIGGNVSGGIVITGNNNSINHEEKKK